MREGGAPLFVQIAEAIAERVADGTLADGVRLPAERELAARLEVNRATVGRAYRLLESRRLVRSRVGSGTVVVAAAAEPPPPSRAALPLSRGIRELARASVPPALAARDGAIDFALMLPDVDLFPRRRLVEAVEAALERGAEVLQYGSPAGLGSLRQALAERLRSGGVAATADEVLVVNGAQQALDLIAKVVLDPGDAVVVEAPTYANVLPLLKLYSARIVGVPLDAQGVELEALERALQGHRPKLLYTIPSFHNPTGITMSLARRSALLAACRRHGTLVVEDGYEDDLRYEGEPLKPLVALAEGAPVLYLGTFSKGLFPGLRLGFIHARGELLHLLTLAKRYTDYHAGLLAQAVLAEILARGDYDRHIDRLRRTYRGRMRRTVQALRQHLPPSVRWRAPEGGYTLWLELPEQVRASAVAEEAARQGVVVLAGQPFFSGDEDGDGGLRISISRTDPERIEEGIAILGRVLREAIEGRESGRLQPSPALV